MAKDLKADTDRRIKELEEIPPAQRTGEQRLELEDRINRRDAPTQQDLTKKRSARISELKKKKDRDPAEESELKQLEQDAKAEAAVLGEKDEAL